MKLVAKPIDTLISPKYNPRRKLTPEDGEYQKIKRSIDSFGYVDPIIYNKRTMHIVGGNQRWQVLKDLGYPTVQCVEVDLDDAQEKALNVALNKISGEWDMELVHDLLLELDAGGFDITLTGFDMSEILPPVEDPLKEWDGMPEYVNEDETGLQSIVVHFKTEEAVRDFAELVKQKITDKTKSLWFPQEEETDLASKGYK